MIEEACLLTDEDLGQLAAALRAGRLAPPFSGIALRRYVPDHLAEAVAGSIRRLHAEGLRPEHLAAALDVLRADRSRRGHPADDVELIWTGPESRGAANRDTSVVVRELFGSARTHVLVVGYAVYQGQDIFRALADRMDRDPSLVVRMFLDVKRSHDDPANPGEILRRFAVRFRSREWPGRRLPELFYDPRSFELDSAKRSSLHAKCIVVDHERSFVSSANFTEAAHHRNIEVGVLLRSRAFSAHLSQHFESLAMEGALRPIPVPLEAL